MNRNPYNLGNFGLTHKFEDISGHSWCMHREITYLY